MSHHFVRGMEDDEDLLLSLNDESTAAPPNVLSMENKYVPLGKICCWGYVCCVLEPADICNVLQQHYAALQARAVVEDSSFFGRGGSVCQTQPLKADVAQVGNAQ